MQLTPLQMEEILFTLCGGSVHTHQTEIAQGYVTLENGCRAGLGGRFLQNPEQGTVLRSLPLSTCALPGKRPFRFHRN